MAEGLLSQKTLPTHMGVGATALPVNAVNLLPSADFSGSDPAAVLIPTLNAVGLIVFVNMTAASGAGNTVTVFLDALDPVSGQFINLGSVALTSAVQGFAATFDPRVATAAGKSSQTPIPDQCRLRFVRSGTTTTLTYSAGAALCL